MTTEPIKLGLIRGRHDIPGITDYVFDSIEDPTDLRTIKQIAYEKLSPLSNNNELHIYVTGLTVALVEVINICIYHHIDLILWHYNRDTNDYYPQPLYSYYINTKAS